MYFSELARQEKYADAIAIAEWRYQETGDPRHILVRANAFFRLGAYEAAAADYEMIRAVEPLGDERNKRNVRLATCYWYLNQPLLALQEMRRPISQDAAARPSFAGHAALLLYLGHRADDVAMTDQAMRVLQRHANWVRRRLAYLPWYQRIAPYLVGMIAQDSLEDSSALPPGKHEIIKFAHGQIDFACALHSLSNGDRTVFAARMTRCAENSYADYYDANRFHERDFARWEVERGFPEQPFSEVTR